MFTKNAFTIKLIIVLVSLLVLFILFLLLMNISAGKKQKEYIDVAVRWVAENHRLSAVMTHLLGWSPESTGKNYYVHFRVEHISDLEFKVHIYKDDSGLHVASDNYNEQIVWYAMKSYLNDDLTNIWGDTLSLHVKSNNNPGKFTELVADMREYENMEEYFINSAEVVDASKIVDLISVLNEHFNILFHTNQEFAETYFDDYARLICETIDVLESKGLLPQGIYFAWPNPDNDKQDYWVSLRIEEMQYQVDDVLTVLKETQQDKNRLFRRTEF